MLSDLPLGSEEKMENGTYRGFAYTDGSGATVGELELVVDDDLLGYRFATGLEIRSEQAPRSELRELDPDEVAAHFRHGVNTVGTTGYILNKEDIVFLVLPDAGDDAARVMVLRFGGQEVYDLLGPALLFTPDQVQNGCFERVLNEIEAEYGDGVVPRLADNGERG